LSQRFSAIVIDDEEDSATYARGELNRAGFHVDIFRDAISSIEGVGRRASDIDLVVLDRRLLPGIRAGLQKTRLVMTYLIPF
jgi:DNA-binding response OmpR family regulator